MRYIPVPSCSKCPCGSGKWCYRAGKETEAKAESCFPSWCPLPEVGKVLSETMNRAGIKKVTFVAKDTPDPSKVP